MKKKMPLPCRPRRYGIRSATRRYTPEEASVRQRWRRERYVARWRQSQIAGIAQAVVATTGAEGRAITADEGWLWRAERQQQRSRA